VLRALFLVEEAWRCAQRAKIVRDHVHTFWPPAVLGRRVHACWTLHWYQWGAHAVAESAPRKLGGALARSGSSQMLAVVTERGRRVHAKLGKNRFATQIYSRLTNANPELVLAFMRAGQGHRPIKVSPPPSPPHQTLSPPNRFQPEK
jgi:hypothetical protein